MNRPHIVCHMVTSIDGKVTGDFLQKPETSVATEVYYDINRTRQSDGFICGRVTMEGSFTQGYYPDLTEYKPIECDGDYIPDNLPGFYAVAFDTMGKLGWRSCKIIDPDGDPGYDGAQIIEVLSEQADRRYLSYLRTRGIPYIFAGKTVIDIKLALRKLYEMFGCKTLLLEGGSVINGAFLRAGAVDELSLVVAPVVGEAADKPLFAESALSGFELVSCENHDGVPVLMYKARV